MYFVFFTEEAGFFNPAPKTLLLRTMGIINTNYRNASKNVMLHIIDTWAFGLYTLSYENNNKVFFTPTGNSIHYVIGGFNGIGMDGTNYVHDEISVKLWRKYGQFCRSDIAYDTVYHIDNYSVCHVYRDYICL